MGEEIVRSRSEGIICADYDVHVDANGLKPTRSQFKVPFRKYDRRRTSRLGQFAGKKAVVLFMISEKS